MCMGCSLHHNHISPISIQHHRQTFMIARNDAILSGFNLFILEAKYPAYKYLLASFLLPLLLILSHPIYLYFVLTYLHSEFISFHLNSNNTSTSKKLNKMHFGNRMILATIFCMVALPFLLEHPHQLVCFLVTIFFAGFVSHIACMTGLNMYLAVIIVMAFLRERFTGRHH